MKQLLIIAVTLSVGFFTGNYWSSSDSINIKASHDVIDNNADIIQLRNHNANLQLENNSLRQQLIDTQNVPKTVTHNVISSEKNKFSNQEAELERLNAKITADTIHNTLRNTSYNPSSYLAQNFENEGIDSAWADAEQQKLSNWFINNEEFSNFALQEVSCRTTQCKISVAANTHEQANDIFSKLSGALRENYSSSLYFSDTDIANSKTTIYVSFAQNQ